jgi:hypothetical protein
MIRMSSWLMVTMTLLLAGAEGRGQSIGVNPLKRATSLALGVRHDQPAGCQDTVRIVDRKGMTAASVQAGRFPPIDVSGVRKDGAMLVLTVNTV